jgi:hypothetical protein
MGQPYINRTTRKHDSGRRGVKTISVTISTRSKVPMAYLPPFNLLKQKLDFKVESGELQVSVSYDRFSEFLQLLLRAVSVDEQWYMDTYPDIRQAFDAGEIASAKEHFVTSGYFEGRIPFKMLVEEDWYLRTYPDIGQAIASGAVNSAEDHFRKSGYEEGRLPAGLK